MEKNNELPKNWILTTLWDITGFKKNAIVDGPFGSNLLLSDYLSDGEIPVLTTKIMRNISEIKSARKISLKKFNELQRSQVVGGDILIAKIGSIGLTCLYPNGYPVAMIPANLCKITPDNSIVNTSYLKYWLDSLMFKNFLNAIVSATAQPAFGITKFKKLPIPLPPLCEQKKIVEKVEELFSKLEYSNLMLKNIKHKLHQYKQSILLHLTTDIFFEHKNWNKMSLAQLGSWHGGGTPSKNNSKFWKNGVIPWISPKDMHQLEINDSRDKITPTAIEESSTKLIKSNSVLLVVRSGILQHTLPIALTKIDVTLNQDMKSITPNESIIPKYLLFSLLALSHDIRNTCSKHGTTVQSIEVPKLMKYEINIPPINEQKNIILKLESNFSLIHNSEKIIDSLISNLKIIRSSILKQAFEGKLIPQDPNDEPASELLKKIQLKIKKDVKNE